MDTYRMWRIKLEIILLLLLSFFFQGRAQVKNDTTQSKTKFFDKISTHWVPTYLIGDPDFMYAQRNDFKSNTFVEVYIEGFIVKDIWLFNMLNRITEMRHEQKQTPLILIKVLLKPENETLTRYSVNLNVTASQKLSVDLAGMTSQAASQHLNKTLYKEPLDAINDIEKAIAHILQSLKTSLGNSLAPNLLLRYNNDIYWSGHEITVLANEGNSVELEALDKNLQPIPSSELTWTNASPFMHKGVVDLTGLNTQQVSVQHKQGRQTDIASVTLKRVNVTENINDLFKLLIVEVLSVKKQEAQDSVVRLKNDSIANAQSISRAILALESQNFPLEGGETPMALFNEGAQLLLQADEALFNNNTQRVTSFNLLKRRKALWEGIRKKVNVVAFANLIVDQPEKVELLLDGLLRSSGQLVAQLILNQDQNGMRTAARNIVVDYLNKNIEAVAGSTFGFAQPGEPPLQLLPNTTNNNMPIFKPDIYLYLNPMLDFEGKSEFITETNNYLSSLSEPLYVFINYSHDVSTESYLQRSSATRPKGLTDGVRFIALTLINIPGSTKFQLVGNKTIQLQSESSVKEILKLYIIDDKEIAMTSWTGTLVDKQHTKLFDHVYASNHIGELEYLTEIERLIKSDPSKEIWDLNYDDEHKAWVNSWKIRVVNSETVPNNTIKVIQETKKGDKLGKIYLRPKHIYIAKYKYKERDYPIAIYNSGTSDVMDMVFTKVEITDIDELDEEENKKRVYIEETFFSYFIVAFYEEGKSIPTLMIQVEKFPFSDLTHNSMKEWLRFLKILVEKEETKSDEDSNEEDAPKFELDLISITAEDAADVLLEKFNQESVCNYGVRDAFYTLTGDSVLFPMEGSICYICDPDKTIKGETSNPGRANHICDDLANDKYRKFELLPTVHDPNHPENKIPDFAKIQDLANKGYLVIGAKKKEGGSGHVVLAVPGDLVLYERGNVTKDKYNVPVVLDCGYGDKFSKVAASEKWKNQVLNTKWYLYKP